MHNFHRQQGKSLILVALFFIMAAFFLIIFFKLIPAYLEYFNVRTSMDSLLSESKLKNASTSQRIILARRMLRNRLMVNDVKSVKMKRDVKFSKEEGGLQIQIKYTRLEHVMGNVDALMTFDRKILIPFR